MPPTINDFDSTPAGTITLKEGSSITLKCFADAKPDPIIKWYRWNKYKHMISDKEELDFVGNELVIASIKRTDANMYECIARNSVPPATSRIFNIEIHFLPTVELEVRKTFQFLHRKFSLECKITSNPLEKVYWYKNGMVFSPDEHTLTHNSNDPQQQPMLRDDSNRNGNIRVNKYDISNINEYYKLMLTLTVLNAFKEDFGEYQCCAVNVYGQICSNIFVQELKHAKEQEHHGEHKPTQSNNGKSSSSSLLEKLFTNEDATNVKPYSSKSLSKQQPEQSQDLLGGERINSIYPNDETSSNRNEIKNIQNTNEQDDLFYDETNELSNKNRNEAFDNENDLSNDDDEDNEDDAQSSSENNLDDINSVDSKDKRRHYLIKSKQLADSGKLWALQGRILILRDFNFISFLLRTAICHFELVDRLKFQFDQLDSFHIWRSTSQPTSLKNKQTKKKQHKET